MCSLGLKSHRDKSVLTKSFIRTSLVVISFADGRQSLFLVNSGVYTCSCILNSIASVPDLSWLWLELHDEALWNTTWASVPQGLAKAYSEAEGSHCYSLKCAPRKWDKQQVQLSLEWGKCRFQSQDRWVVPKMETDCDLQKQSLPL